MVNLPTHLSIYQSIHVGTLQSGTILFEDDDTLHRYKGNTPSNFSSRQEENVSGCHKKINPYY